MPYGDDMAGLVVALLAVVHPLGGPDYAAMVPPPVPVTVVADDPIIWFHEPPFTLDGAVVPWSYALGWFVESGRAKCESGRAWNSTRDGYFQMIPQTWRAYGGTTRYAGDADPAEQVRVFLAVLDGQGARAWSCMRGRP